MWTDGGRSFEVVTAGGMDLTEDGCFDTMPTDEQIAALLPEPWFCPKCGAGYSQGDPDLIVEHYQRH